MRGAWVAQTVKVFNYGLTQVMIPQFVSSSPTSGSALRMHSLLEILSYSLFLCPSLPHSLSLSLKNK